VQRFRQWWVVVLALGLAALAWWLFVRQVVLGREFGDNPAPDWAMWLLWAVIGVVLPLTFMFVRLVLEVTDEGVLVRFVPLTRRLIRLEEIESLEVRTYNALAEYGGWGIKGWTGSKIAYNVSGNQGVDLTLRDGRRIMLGSQRADELAAAIEARISPDGTPALRAKPPTY
jgi:hypothetical protein